MRIILLTSLKRDKLQTTGIIFRRRHYCYVTTYLNRSFSRKHVEMTEKHFSCDDKDWYNKHNETWKYGFSKSIVL